ncbi:hypothetical protein [Lentzea sp. E54]|uniref:hypothetical protein n=1 Tax=Lentzea xerophila TaxID=3435883 RepID=UPI003DA315FF
MAGGFEAVTDSLTRHARVLRRITDDLQAGTDAGTVTRDALGEIGLPLGVGLIGAADAAQRALRAGAAALDATAAGVAASAARIDEVETANAAELRRV